MIEPSDSRSALASDPLPAAQIVFQGGGELGALCRAYDWASTPLGSVEEWPQSLRTAAQITVAAGLPSIVLWGRELIQIYNDAYARLIRAKHPAALGHRNRDIWPEVWSLNEPIFERVFAGETVTQEDALYPLERTGAAEDVYLTLSFSPVRDETGEVAGVVVNLRETTHEVAVRRLNVERETLIDELELERGRLEYVFHTAPDFLAVLRGPDYVFELANDAYYQLVGRRNLIGRPVFEALSEVRGQGFEEILDAVVATGEPFVGREVPVILERTPGAVREERYVDFIYLPLIEPDGSRSGIITHGTDVTDHVLARQEVERLLGESESARADAESARSHARRAQEEAEEANKAKSQFLANMSHEIRTPINAILGYADLLEIGVPGTLSSSQLLYVERIKRSSAHLVGLVNEILDLSKIEAGGMTVDHEPLLVRRTAREAAEMVLPLAQAKSIRLTKDASCDGGALYVGDADRVRQILVNLLSNAIKFTASGGQVTVRCRVLESIPDDAPLAGEGPWVAIEVEDTGIGIAPEQYDSIFEAFVQVDAGHTRIEGGTGLGLTISRRLARMMGGELTVKSRPGHGSCFTLWLPALGESAAGPPAADAGVWPVEPGAVRGLAEIGHLLTEHADSLERTFADRLAADLHVPHARGLNPAQISDHLSSLISAIGKALVSVDEGKGDPSLLSDGAEIRRIISNLHGDQRRRLGWTRDELRREYRILREETEALLRREVGDPGASIDAAMEILHRLLDLAERATMKSFWPS
jgi:signal transduction histidine kinase